MKDIGPIISTLDIGIIISRKGSIPDNYNTTRNAIWARISEPIFIIVGNIRNNLFEIRR